MHFSIPDVQEINDGNGSTFIGYNIHINGVFHCTVRYKQLHNLHEQLKKEFGYDNLPCFPPKKILPLTGGQIDERRSLLEKYIQMIGQDTKIFSSDLITGFLLSAQQETSCETNQEVSLDIYTMNNYRISVRVLAFDRTEQVLTKVCKTINLAVEYAKYFSLYLIKEDNSDIYILRKLLNLESPHMSHKSIKENNKIYLRKSYWDISFDKELMNDPLALNLLYVQTVAELEKGWILCTKDTRLQLTKLQAKLAKKDYIKFAATLKYYGYTQFSPCLCDYPNPKTKVLIAIGDHELNMRIIDSGPHVKEGCFKVTRMRCWRITATHNKIDNAANSQMNNTTNLELSFEYLMSKDKLQWVTVTSEQAILMSLCLQSLVDELLVKKNGYETKNRGGSKGPLTYMKRDGSSHLISLDNLDININKTEGNKIQDTFSIKKLQEKFSVVSFKSGRGIVENHAFEGIGDDNL
ncbi:hypothetical protein WA026_008964 [Henosepilachna vigintioctopunctata]|uniref:PX domain-containing protein n=1 Tax=Henosepilachna vigintioctopunctata TaxID=420089 RepID=A0AAW1V9P6_9CUCU